MDINDVINAIRGYYEENDEWPKDIWVGHDLFCIIARDAERSELIVSADGNVKFCDVLIHRTGKIGMLEFALTEPSA